ncbi:hypothetical protein DAERI_010340 [Deinococcus aerius]|uniref:Uncharacterized protein n=1 Tax=Deinococcus aerius TaxID=200253 RepID=A0A2I9DDZ6_9DEIO|nr:hypothetical protein [Deinococcus aerius]GBF04168.1 hypothetical protein DAERI_010340 [Deinococcus aerius]
MTEDIRALLMAYDSPNPQDWEAPEGFSEREREALLTQVRTLAGRIEALLCVPVEYDDQYQDASCVADLYVKTPDDREAIIRFSSFGQMAVIFRWAQGARLPIQSPLEPLLLPLVEQGGFAAIPPEELALPYDGPYGRCAGTFNNTMTWFERYFDYL